MLAQTSAPDLLARTAPLYERVKAVIPPIEWPVFARDIDAILDLKRTRNATATSPQVVPRKLPAHTRSGGSDDARSDQ